MNMQEIRGIAKEHGVKPARLSKIDLVHAIQRDEGNFDCFATAYDNYCDQDGCLWRSDCFAAAKGTKKAA
jgi:hypothetical protein